MAMAISVSQSIQAEMSRIFGYLVGAIWLVLGLAALSSSFSGWGEGHSDLGFWWAVVGVLLLIASTAAFVGTARYRYQGPKK